MSELTTARTVGKKNVNRFEAVTCAACGRQSRVPIGSSDIVAIAAGISLTAKIKPVQRLNIRLWG